jgi:hypothetical protein
MVECTTTEEHVEEIYRRFPSTVLAKPLVKKIWVEIQDCPSLFMLLSSCRDSMEESEIENPKFREEVAFFRDILDHEGYWPLPK